MWLGTHAVITISLRVAHAPAMPGTFSPTPRASDSDMHHGTCVTHVPWSMPGSLTNGFLWRQWRENVPGIPGACATHNLAYLVRGPWTLLFGPWEHYYHQTSNISWTLGTNKIVDRMSASLQLYLRSRLNTWLQGIGQRNLQDETRNI